jgi:hypothetical protein
MSINGVSNLWRRPVGVFLAALIALCAIPAFAIGDGTYVVSPQSEGLSWQTRISITDGSGNVIEALPAGGEATVQFGLSLIFAPGSEIDSLTSESAILNETFTFYVNSAPISAKSALKFINPTITSSNVPMFTESSLSPVTSGKAIDGSDDIFYRYQFEFNRSPEAIVEWNNFTGVSAMTNLSLDIRDDGENVPPSFIFIHVDNSSKADIELPYLPPGETTPPTNSALLTKEQVVSSAAAEAIFESIVSAVPVEKRSGYKPAGSDVITDANTYTVFKIVINEQGLAKLHTNSIDGDVSPAAFREIVPSGMAILTVEDSNANVYYGIKLIRTTGNPYKPFVDEDGKTGVYIDYDRALNTEIAFRGHDDNIRSMKAWTTAADGNNVDDSSRFGLTSSFIPPGADADHGGGELLINFGKAPAGQPAANYYDNAEYTLYVIMVPDEIPETPAELTNHVTLDYPEILDGQAADSSVYLTRNAGSAGVKKYVLGMNVPGSNKYISGDYVVTLPGILGEVYQPYRLLLPSAASTPFAPGTVTISDYGDERYIDLSEFQISDVDVRAYSSIVEAEISNINISGATPATTAMAVTEIVPGITKEKAGFAAGNVLEIPATRYYHTFDYAYKYVGVPYGVAIKNTAIRSVYTVTPLKFDLLKFDQADQSKTLTGWEFAAYYSKADDPTAADRSRPVLDIYGNPTAFTATSGSLFVVPEGYSPRSAGSWHVVFVETKQPIGYPASNIGLQVPAVITSTDTGTLSVAPLVGDSSVGADGAKASYVTFSAVTGEVIVTAYNKAGAKGPDRLPGKVPGKVPGSVTTPPAITPPGIVLPGFNPPGAKANGKTGDDFILPTYTASGGTGKDITGEDVPLAPFGGDGETVDGDSRVPGTGDDQTPGILFAVMIAAIIALLIVRRELKK